MPQALAARSRRHPPPAERRARILEAALRCFAEKGYHEATMDDVARAAGVSKGGLYWHFASKAEVFGALFGAFSLELFDAWEAEAARHTGSAIELVGRVGELTLERIARQRALLSAWAEFLVHREVQEPLAAAYRSSRRLLAGWLRAGMEAGEVRALPPEAVAAAAVALVEGLLIQTAVDPAFDPRSRWATAWAVFARGLAP